MKDTIFTTILLILWGVTVFSSEGPGEKGWLSFNDPAIPDLPKEIGGAFVGIDNGVMIVAGGSCFDNPLWDEEKKIYSDSIFVCQKKGDTYHWSFAGKLPVPVAHGATVPLPGGLLCMGGQNQEHKLSEVYLLHWDIEAREIIITPVFSPLPEGRSYMSASVLEDFVYVLGGKVGEGEDELITDSFLKLDLSEGQTVGWANTGGFPGGERFGSTMVTQGNGDYNCLFLFGGKSNNAYLSDAYRFDPKESKQWKQWKQLSAMPGPAMGVPSIAVGGSQVFIFSGSDGRKLDQINELKEDYRFPRDILAYNTITDVWYKMGELQTGVVNTTALEWEGLIIIPGGEPGPGRRTTDVVSISVNPARDGHFSTLDYIMLFAYLGLIAWLGYFLSAKNKSSNDFFLGGQKIPFWAAGLSMMAAQVSSIGFMAIPAKAFATNWSYFAGVLTWFVAVPLVIYAFVPFYRRLNVTSAYEYLEKRFNSFIRLFVAALYLLFQLVGRLGAIIFLPAIALSSVTGMDAIICILIIGGLSTLYTVLGGMHAVIWIDVIQAIVLFGGIFLIIFYIFFNIDGGVNEFVDLAWNDHKFSFGSMDINLTTAVFWVIIIGNIFNRVGTMSTDQSVVQRYLTTRNEKETAKALWTDVAVSIPWAMCVFGLGTALYVYYKANPGQIDPTLANDEIVPFFIGQNLPAGISGVIIAGIFAASMSSVDSSIHSSTTVLMRDFLNRVIKMKTEKQKVRIARWITAGLGVMGTSIAVVMTFFDIASVWDIVLEFAGLFTGAMTGVFILGIFSKKANGKGAVAGALISACLLFYIQNFTQLHFFLYSGIGIISCVLIGWLSSFMFSSGKSIEGLTIYSVLKKD